MGGYQGPPVGVVDEPPAPAGWAGKLSVNELWGVVLQGDELTPGHHPLVYAGQAPGPSPALQLLAAPVDAFSLPH